MITANIPNGQKCVMGTDGIGGIGMGFSSSSSSFYFSQICCIKNEPFSSPCPIQSNSSSHRSVSLFPVPFPADEWRKEGRNDGGIHHQVNQHPASRGQSSQHCWGRLGDRRKADKIEEIYVEKGWRSRWSNIEGEGGKGQMNQSINQSIREISVSWVG